MNAIVDIYLDNNLGDNIMGETLIKFLHQKGVKCFVTATDDYTYSNFIKKFPSVQIVPDISTETIKRHKIDFYVRIGGSIFPHNNMKEGIFRYIKLYQYLLLKKSGVKIFILGCNVGPFKSKVGIKATKQIFKIADLITCRDKESFNYIRKYNMKASFLYPDIVFSREDLEIPQNKEDVLGMSTYTGYVAALKKYNHSYCELMIDIANRYLEEKPHGKIKLFAFDTGYNSDYPTTHTIYNGIREKDKVQIIGFNGDIMSFMSEFNRCNVMIGTRFHAIILAVLCKIPVLPIIYSNKTDNLLRDLEYDGPKVQMAECKNIDREYIVSSILEKNTLLYNYQSELRENSQGHLVALGDKLETM
ncbi:polysaccharide pyruvyl transferase family protein [Neobacillus vireti]|uniref:Polysaccharide pyruvyl transferase domain-containing protein n=1 Tax=Neobacillus vireti LMG 21834 TaxID=1131730 RepID=A0AB94IQ50_9BACI|nr:polysaccharide pyruvyl transferase family protein [Neobacillus vireti]ETI69196.1 hypothetical protein BAVI_08856 [Neobacillus vireti LMG 21834]KLT15569.1 hypothetical protein AA980_23295 [Neobacillus vireti]